MCLGRCERLKNLVAVLTTGRVKSHWHTRTKTALVGQLNAHGDRPYISVNPSDAHSLGLLDGQLVRVHSRRGVARSVLHVDQDVPIGSAFMPIHWNDLFAVASSPNEVTTDATDPLSKQPSLKFCAIRLEADRDMRREPCDKAAPATLVTSPEVQRSDHIAVSE